ncbi:MAG: ACP S-malonyltransferase, partial [Candidatus Krumholzibacteriota bacterium]|nr:ACP S-malonyltransferase [Candidatus Krumholzibacteriota bacterium]
QLVISGHLGAVERAMTLAQEKKAKKVVRLNVSGAFHSPLVAPAQEELVAYINNFRLRDASVDVICNAAASRIRSREEIVDALSRQLTSPVLWSDSMLLLTESWEGEIIEAGPGRVLSGLLKRINRKRTVKNAGTAEELRQAVVPAEVLE